MDHNLQKKLYFGMLRIRMVEEAIAARYQEQEMRCPVHLCIGQEAIAVGVCENLSKRDYVMSTHRSHGHYLAKGGDLRALLAEIYGKAAGCSRGIGGSQHLVDLDAGFLGSTPIVGGIIPIAVGTALGSSMKGEDRVSVVFMGDAATETGAFSECLNFASLKKLPVVFVCENNFFSVYSPLSVRQPARRNNALLAESYGIYADHGDGNNMLEIYEKAAGALKHVRRGGGPVYLEFATYRWREHCGPDFDHHLGYRTESEYQEWRGRCPLQHLEASLKNDGVIADDDIKAMRREISAEIDAAFQFAIASPFPAEEDLYNHLYAD
ncbi:MAG: thiamine pyrophosphate-dependent dehydrogenase E1 component subunit alpha [Deltaproteobacteria bacterium]